MEKSITLYIKSGCPWCIEAENYLKSNGYQYERVDVRRDVEAFAEMRRLSGQTYAPTMTVDGKLLADFDTDELEEFLAEHQIKP